MSGAPVLFELSGEHPTLPRAEAMSCLIAESPDHRVLGQGPGYLLAECGSSELERIAERLALCHRLGEHLGSCPVSEMEEMARRLELPDGSISVRVRSVEGLHPGLNSMDVARRTGAALAGRHRIDLTSPDNRLRVLLSDRAHFFLEVREIDRKQFDGRKVAERPYFSPISLHPRYARALVNLTCARKGDRLLDPFCGTGGIVLEAALLGLRAIGSDIDPQMVDGCRRNLEHFGVQDAIVEVSDIGDVPHRFGGVDAVATDPPYGRAASTKKEEINGLYDRGLKAMREAVSPGKRVAVVLPREIASDGLRLEQLHLQKVHRSLTRHYHVFIRP